MERTLDIHEVTKRVSDFTRDAILITEAEPWDEPGPRIVWVNKPFTEMMGYEFDEVVGRSPRMFQRDDFDPKAGTAIREGLENWRSVRQVVRNYTKFGKPVWIELDISPVADETGWYHYWVAVQRDVTERVDTQLKLEEAERRFEIAASVSLIGVWDWNLLDNSLFWSDEFCDMVGISRDEFTEDFAAFDARLHPEDRLRVHEAVHAHLHKDSPFKIEYRLLHSDGHYIDVKAKGAAMRSASGQPIRMIGSVQDITEERRKERRLALALDEAREAREAADAANKAKSQFLANMSHEIRTPLNGILGMSHLLSKSELPEKQSRHVSLISQSGNSLKSLIDDILDISKIEAGHLKVVPREFNVKDVVERSSNAIRALAEAKKIDFILSIDPLLDVNARADDRLIEQIIINLAGNAVKFTNEGRVSISAKLDSDKMLLVRVSDTGIGIPRKALSSIFDRFEQVDVSNTRKHGGSGLGLAIAKGVIETIGGTISVESTEGEGSAFQFKVPLELTETVSDDLHEQRSKLGDDTKKHVLIAEDNCINQEVFIEVLEGAGYRITLANDGVEALEALNEDTTIEVLLLDLQMPRLSGIGVLEELKKGSHKASSIPVIAVSANVGSETMDQVFQKGALEFIPKPFDPADLLAAIERVLPNEEHQNSVKSVF